MNKLTFVFILFSVSSYCFSAPYIYEDGAYKFKAENIDECYGLGTSSPMLGVCQDHFKNLSENKVNSSYKSLLSKLNRDKKGLIEAQAKWEEFIELQCQFEASASKSFSKPYKVYTEMFEACLDKLRIERASYLNNIQSGCAGCVQ